MDFIHIYGVKVVQKIINKIGLIEISVYVKDGG